MTHSLTAAPPEAPLTVHTSEAQRLAAYIEGRAGTVAAGDGFAAITHGLLAIAAAIQASHSDTGDTLAGMAADLADLGTTLGDGLAGIDDTLTEVATEIAAARPARWRWRRRPAPVSLSPSAAAGHAAVCDNTSAGVLIEDSSGRFLVFDRATGVAPAAGHVDGHGGFEQAARAEVAEELGLTVTGLSQLAVGWRDNRCRRAPGHLGTGHKWAVYQAAVSGELRPSARETRNARWLTPAELQDLASRTAAYAHGRRTAADFTAEPGVEPVWVRWLADAGIIHATADDLAAIDRIASHDH